MAKGRHALWSGSVTFGLVSVPVAALPVVRSARTAFHLLHRPDASRLQRRMFCPEENVFVHPEHIQRGFEVEPGRFIVISDEEIDAIAPGRSKTIEIQQFVPVESIGPACYARPYYLVPTRAAKPYQLLAETLAKTGRAGLSEFVMHAREHLAAVQSVAGVLCLMLLRYPAQLRDSQDVQVASEARDEDVAAISQEIEKAAGPFRPEDLEDEYRRRVEDLIDRKRQAGQIVQGPDVPESPEQTEDLQGNEEVDLVAALEASLAQERSRGE